MFKRAFILGAALLCVALTEPPKTRFITPRPRVVMRSPMQELYVPVQWYISRHPDNRAYVVTCRGACYWTAGPDSMDGDAHEAILPWKPVNVALDGYGVATFTLQVYGAGGKLRERAETEVRVCGSDEIPC
jgi:hypothetical protein